jgi:hypothetical protein
MALITMAFGAVLFSLQYPDFSANGLRSAGLLVALVLPYRLLQRMLLAEPWRWGNMLTVFGQLKGVTHP